MDGMEQVIFNWAVGIAGFFGGWMLKVIWDAIQDLKSDLKTTDARLHQDFVRRDDFKEAMAMHTKNVDELKRDMRDGLREVNSTLLLIFKKLESKEDKE
jgi:hypothetical protein